MLSNLRAEKTHQTTRPGMSLLALALCALPWHSYAALGSDVGPIQADQANMNASQHISEAAAYQVYELQTAAGMVVREYVSTAGAVFAVAWQGPMLPDLQRLLGTYFATYTQAAQTQHGGHGHLIIRLDDLVVESNGHMRAFFGRAYLPHSLPHGLAVSDIQ